MKKYKVYMGDVMGEPRILVEYKGTKIEEGFDPVKSLVSAAKRAQEINNLVVKHILPSFRLLLDERGIEYHEPWPINYLTITKQSMCWWGDKDHKHIIVVPAETVAKSMVGKSTNENDGPELFMDVEQWY